MTTKILGAAMHDDIGTEGQGIFQAWRSKSGVDGEVRTPFVGLLGEGLYAIHLSIRVEWSLKVNHVTLAQTKLVPGCLVVQVGQFQPVHLGVQGQNTMATVIATHSVLANGNDVGSEIHHHGVK